MGELTEEEKKEKKREGKLWFILYSHDSRRRCCCFYCSCWDGKWKCIAEYPVPVFTTVMIWMIVERREDLRMCVRVVGCAKNEIFSIFSFALLFIASTLRVVFFDGSHGRFYRFSLNSRHFFKFTHTILLNFPPMIPFNVSDYWLQKKNSPLWKKSKSL